MQNKSWTSWFEIPVTDFDRAKKFYETIFEIEIHTLDFGTLKMGLFPHRLCDLSRRALSTK